VAASLGDEDIQRQKAASELSELTMEKNPKEFWLGTKAL
jgi:hypothetical protein